MTYSDAVIKRLTALCAERDITVNKLATLSGITQSTLENLILGNTKYPRIITISYICQGLQIELKDFFDDPLFKNLDDED